MPDTRMTCRACGGSGRMFGREDAVWCDTCGGAGHVPADVARGPGGGGSGVGLGGTLRGLGGLALVVVVIGLPVVALVVVLDWFVVLGAPLRSLLEGLPGDLGIVTSAGGDGNPLVVTALAAVAVLVAVVLVALRLGRTVRATERAAQVWQARGWGLLLGVVVVSALPFVVTVWAVASGFDLERPGTVPTMTHPGHVAVVVLVVLLFGWLWTGRRYVVAHRRAARAAVG